MALKIVLIVGSAPDAMRAISLDKSKIANIVVINNAWRVCDDWDFLIYPEDFPDENKPLLTLPNQRVITAADYVPIQNQFGGFVYAGGTMAFTAAYWALGALQPDVLAFIGCDMVYDTQAPATHFYGAGTADPLRDDVSLQSLEAKSARLFYMAHEHACLCVNLSDNAQSRLTFPRASLADFDLNQSLTHQHIYNAYNNQFDQAVVKQASSKERDLAYYFESGRYWEHLNEICPQQLASIDGLWANSLSTRS